MANYRNRASLERLVSIGKALADPNRVRALFACRGRELCVCQITELLGLAPSTVSKHLSILRQAGLLESRKKGRWIYYRQCEEESTPAAREAIDLVMRTLSRDRRMREDERRLREILRIDADELCAKQRCAQRPRAGARSR